MPLIPDKLNLLPEFQGRERLYSSISPDDKGGLDFIIRILTVVPNHDHLAPIEASLSIAVLQLQGQVQEVEYNAVSYYWGDTNELENVTIHGSDEGMLGLVYKVPVTKSLTAALRQFRLEASANEEPLRLWIDALCINQTDAAERRTQVLNMRHIFTQATSVWVWLGESNELVEKGLSTLVGQSYPYALHKTRRGAAALPTPHFMSSSLSVDEEVSYIKQFAAIAALPYWRRGWTFQENMQPYRHVCFGGLKIELRSWTLLLLVVNLYVQRIKLSITAFLPSLEKLLTDSEKSFLGGIELMAAAFMPFAFAEEAFDRKNAAIGQLSIGDDERNTTIPARGSSKIQAIYQSDFFLNTFYRTSNPRDSVFALLDIVPGLANVKLDYDSTPEHIFSVATEALLRNNRDGLRDLPQWLHPQASSQLPSWVFDFTHCNNAVDENGNKKIFSDVAVSEFDASVGSLFSVVCCNSVSIHVNGFIYDEILDISERTRPPDDDDGWTAILDSWVRLARRSRKTYLGRSSKQKYTYTMLRTLSSCHDAFTQDESRLLHTVRWRDRPVKILNAIIKQGCMMKSEADLEEFGEAADLLDTIQRNVLRGRFYFTKGRRMGLAPIGAAIGDRIAILASANLPFVLRPVPEDYAGEEAYRIMGGCYVDGTVTLLTTICKTY